MADVARVEEAYRHCEALVRASDKDRFLASLFAPAERRPYLFALYAFALEIARAAAAAREPMAAMIRLQWWIEAVGGLRPEEAAASPVMIALEDAARRTNQSLAPLAAAVEAHQAELEGAPPVGAAAATFAMAARFLGAAADVSAAAEAAGRAVVLAERDADQARAAYRVLRAAIDTVPEEAQPAFLPAALVPLRLAHPHAPQWRRQIALLRAAWLGFPKL
jgi:phytoene synthase